MRTLALTLLLATTGVAAADPALVTVEVRAGVGVEAGGGAGRASMRTAPLVLSALGAWAIRDQPRTSAYAGLVVETLDRTGAGLEAGLELTPSPHLRLHGGARVMAVPYTLWGATFGGGTCFGLAGLRACADLSADVFVHGTDLPADTAATQLLLGLGLVFDAL